MTPAQKKENQLYLNITGMHCASCANIIERSLKKINGVRLAHVNFGAEKANIMYDRSTATTEDFLNAIKKAGYGAEVANAANP